MIVQRISKQEEFWKIRELWNRLLLLSSQNSIFLTHQWFASWWKCFSHNKLLEVLIFKEDGDRWGGIAPLMRDGNRLTFIASQEVTDYCDFIIAQGREKEFYGKFLDTLIDLYPDVQTVEMMNLKSESPTLNLLPSLASEKGFTCSSFESEVAPILKLPSSQEDLLSLMTRKNRHELKRKLKRMDQLKGAQAIDVTDPKGVQAWIRSFIELHRKSGGSKKEFWEKKGMADFFLEIGRQFSAEGWVELSGLSDTDKPVAVLFNFLYGDEIDFYNAAYDKKYAWYSPGLYQFYHRLSRAISERKRKTDFLRGREKYKYYFGAKDSKIWSLILASGAQKA